MIWILVSFLSIIVILLLVARHRSECYSDGRSLRVGESSSMTVNSASYWNDSVVRVKKGERYLLEASGKWTDWFITTTADGYSNWFYEHLTRNPKAPMFSLVGSVAKKPGSDFFVGVKKEMAMTLDGQLSFYANDITHFYWNNKGSLQLKITRLA